MSVQIRLVGTGSGSLSPYLSIIPLILLVIIPKLRVEWLPKNSWSEIPKSFSVVATGRLVTNIHKHETAHYAAVQQFTMADAHAVERPDL